MKNYSILLGALIAATTITTSCKKDDKDAAPRYNLEGNLTNTTSRPLRQATVTITPLGQTSPTATVISDARGHYSLPNVVPGKYLVRAERPGYSAETDTVNVTASSKHNMQVRGTAQVSGVVINSQTGRGLDSAQVSLTFRPASGSADTSLSAADFVVRTDDQGRFTMSDVATGQFTYIVRGHNFNTDVVGTVLLHADSNVIDQHTLVQEVPEGALRIVLTWGLHPSDLDSHLSGPADATGTDRFHMYFSDPDPIADVNLDVDDVTSYGPETTTIRTLRTGTYRFSIHNYSDQTENGGGVGIDTSRALVRVFNHNGLVTEFTPPHATAGSGNTWRVFEATVGNGNVNIQPVNTYVQAGHSSDTDVFRIQGGKKAPMRADKF